MSSTTCSKILAAFGLLILLTLWNQVTCSQPGGSRYTAIQDNGYKNVTVAIHPSVPPDQRSQLIENLKNLLTETSKQLFHSTKQKVYLKEVYFLIPREWTEMPADIGHTATFQSFLQPDITIAPSNPVYGHYPYALQSSRCGHIGHYVHLTPEFVNKPTSVKNAKSVVKAWSQYRYGVFEECGILKDSSHPPLYWKKKELSLTSCAAGALTGKLEGECDPVVYLSEGVCKFVLNSDQSAANPSIMFSTDITEQSQSFCEDQSHNKEAPNRQNALCNEKSIWSVIDGTEEMNSTPIGSDMDTTPKFFTVRATANKYVIAIDTSKNMQPNDKYENVRISLLKLISHYVPDGIKVGLIVFDDKVKRQREFVTISPESRKTLTNNFPRTVNDKVNANIDAAIRAGIEQIREEYNKEKGGQSKLILITNGLQDSQTPIQTNVIEEFCNEMADFYIQLNVILYLDQNSGSSKHDAGLKQLTACSGGRLYVMADLLNDDLFHAVSHELMDIKMRAAVDIDDPRKAPVQLYQRMHKEKVKVSEGWFYVDDTIKHNLTFFVSYDDRKRVEQVTLTDPSGKTFDDQDNAFEEDDAERHISFYIPDVQTGNWTYKVQWLREDEDHVVVVKVMAMPDTEQIRLNCWVKLYGDSRTSPAIGGKTPVVLYAKLMRNQIPIINAHVQVSIILPSDDPTQRKKVTFNLTDDGSGDPDIGKHDGVYSRYFTEFTTQGFYSFWVTAKDNNGLAKILSPGSPSSSSVPGMCNTNQVNVQSTGPFRRSASGESFYISSVDSSSDPFPPARVSDLHVHTVEGNTVTIQWTAVGDNYDTGRVQSYEVRSSQSRDHLTNDRFPNADKVTPQFGTIVDAKEEQTASFIVDKRLEPYYVALRAFDGTQYGQVSNVITVVRQAKDIVYPTTVPTGYNTTQPEKQVDKAGLSTGAIAGIVIALIALIAILVLVLVVRKRKRTKTPSKRTSFKKDYGPVPPKREQEMLDMRHDDNHESSTAVV